MNTRRFFSFFLSLIFISGLTSCSDDDDDNKNGNPAELLIGTWNLTNLSVGIYTQDGKAVEISNEAYDGVGSFTFKPNGELVAVDIEGQQQIVSYEYNKGKIHMYMAGEESVALDVMELTATKLVVELKEVDEDGETSYMRVTYRKNSNSYEKEEEYNTELPSYILLDENLGNQIDYAILGLDGSGYFYEFQDENPNIPQRLSIYDGKKDVVDLVINFDEDGLPKNILSETFTIVLGRYEENKFSAVVITKEGESHTFEDIEINVNWNEYKNEISTIVNHSLLISLRAGSSRSPSILKAVNNVVSAVGCGLSIAGTLTTGWTGIGAVVGAGLTVISCGSLLADIADEAGVWVKPGIIDTVSTVANYASLMKCVGELKAPTNPLTIWSCLTDLIDWALSDAVSKEDSSKEDISSGENMLNSPKIISQIGRASCRERV